MATQVIPVSDIEVGMQVGANIFVTDVFTCQDGIRIVRYSSSQKPVTFFAKDTFAIIVPDPPPPGLEVITQLRTQLAAWIETAPDERKTAYQNVVDYLLTITKGKADGTLEAARPDAG